MNMLSTLLRLYQSFGFGRWRIRSLIPRDSAHTIERIIEESEKSHRGEFRVIIEPSLPPCLVLHGVSPRARAHELFSHFRVWDTAENTGVIFYVLVAERSLEIVADREVSKEVGNERWQEIMRLIEKEFKQRSLVDGVIFAVKEITSELQQKLPANSPEHNELPNRVIVM